MPGKGEILTNTTILLGRLVEQPGLTRKDDSPGGRQWCSFAIAVEKERKTETEKTADFLRCIVFGGPASYLARCGKKGGRVLVKGRLQPGPVCGTGQEERCYTQVVAERIYIIDRRDEGSYAGRPALPGGSVDEAGKTTAQGMEKGHDKACRKEEKDADRN